MSADDSRKETSRDDGHYVRRVHASVARRALQSILRCAQTGPVLVTRQGEPQVVILGVELYRSIENALWAAAASRAAPTSATEGDRT